MRSDGARKPPRSLPRSGLPLLLMALSLLLLGACAPDASREGSSPCLDGSRRCANAQVPEGMRGVLHGHRIRRWQWRARINRESGVPDVGIVADWQPTTLRR